MRATGAPFQAAGAYRPVAAPWASAAVQTVAPGRAPAAAASPPPDESPRHGNSARSASQPGGRGGDSSAERVVDAAGFAAALQEAVPATGVGPRVELLHALRRCAGATPHDVTLLDAKLLGCSFLLLVQPWSAADAADAATASGVSPDLPSGDVAAWLEAGYSTFGALARRREWAQAQLPSPPPDWTAALFRRLGNPRTRVTEGPHLRDILYWAYRTHTRWRPALRRHLGALLASAAGPSAAWPPPPGLAAALDVLASILSGLPAHTAGPLSHALAHHRLLLTDLLLPLYRIPGMVPLEHPPRCALALVAVPLNACVSALVTRTPAWAPPAVDAVLAGWPPAAQASAAKGELLLGAVESIVSAVAAVDASAADDAILAALPAVSVALQDQHAGVATRAAGLCGSQAVRSAACGGTRASAAILRALVPALIGDATPHWSSDVNRARHAALTALQKAQPEAFEAAAGRACGSAAPHPQASPDVAHLLHRLRPLDAGVAQAAAEALEAVSLAPQPVALSDSVGSNDLIFERLLGSGSFSTVHAARVRRPGVPASQWRHVAVKRISGATLTASRYVTACAREVAALRAVTHPGVARLVTAFRWHADVCLILELATGGDLHGAISCRGRLPPANTAFLTGELVAGLGAVHDAGLAFGDLKPENVLLTASGHAKLTDFGAARPLAGSAAGHKAAGRAASRAILAQLRRGDWRSQAGLPPKDGSLKGAGEEDVDDDDDDSADDDDRLEGTTAYLAPELLAGQAPSVATDAWALGCLVALCLTGALPIWSADPEALMQRIAAWTGDTGPLFSGLQGEGAVPSPAIAFVTALLDPVAARRLGSDAVSLGGMRACEQHEWLAQALPCECGQLFSATPPPLPPAAVAAPGSRGPGLAALPRQNSVLYNRRGGGAGGITLGVCGAGGGGQDWSTGAPIPESETEAGASWAPRAPGQGSGAKPPSALRRAGGADLGGIHE